MKNGEERRRMMKNFHRIAYESIREALRLYFSSRKRVFLPKIAEMHSQRGLEPFETAPPPLFIEKREVLAAPRLNEEDF